MHIPRIIISALRGGGGKTLLSLGLTRAFTKTTFAVKPYKKGPDYIDAYWLSLAAFAEQSVQNHETYNAAGLCTNLDPYFLSAQKLQALFVHAWQSHPHAKLALIEGNRGLFDGQDIQGTCSTAELSRVLAAPVLLSLDITKMTRTSAALLQGLCNFEEGVRIGGVVLNQVGSARHEKIVRDTIEHYTDIPILGALPRLKHNPLPERHMGLCQSHTDEAHRILDTLGSFVQDHCDLEAIHALAHSAAPLTAPAPFWTQKTHAQKRARIGYVYDQAFWFYYAENFEALRRAGAELVPLSLLDSTPWPTDLQGLYIGGGYPEEFLPELSASPHLTTLKKYSEQGMPIYAECGGFMVLADTIIRQGQSYPMAGVFSVASEFHSRPQGLGYVQASVQAQNPYHPLGQELRGHEFHYSKCIGAHDVQKSHTLCLQLHKGTGMGKEATSHALDGLYIRQTFASYTHLFAPSCPWWAENFVALAAKFSHCE